MWTITYMHVYVHTSSWPCYNQYRGVLWDTEVYFSVLIYGNDWETLLPGIISYNYQKHYTVQELWVYIFL